MLHKLERNANFPYAKSILAKFRSEIFCKILLMFNSLALSETRFFMLQNTFLQNFGVKISAKFCLCLLRCDRSGSYQIRFDDFVSSDVVRRRDVGELPDEVGELKVAGERRLVLFDELGCGKLVTGADQLEVEVGEQRVQELS